VSWRLTHELLLVIVAVVAWGHFVGVVIAIVVNVGAVLGAGISADMTDVTVAGLYSAGTEALREWAAALLGRACVWAKVPLTRRARR
jgi:hypothetical protein